MHKDKALDAVEKSTDIMMATFLDKIQKASSEESARRSYVTGMTDMLTVARKALGFWGAEQIRMELERWNTAQEPDDCDDDSEEICVHINISGLTREQLSKETKGLQGHLTEWIAEKRRTEQKQARDPMFA